MSIRGRVLTIGSAIILTLVGGGAATAQAAVNSVTRPDGQKLSVAIDGDSVRFTKPLDGNPLTREWFENAKISFSGPANLDGILSFGYEVGYPGTIDGRLTVGYTTPSLSLSLSSGGNSAEVSNILPWAQVTSTVGFGPGIQTVEIARANAMGAHGSAVISGFEGTVTGVLGQVRLRPYVKLSTSTGDVIVVYGNTWVG